MTREGQVGREGREGDRGREDRKGKGKGRRKISPPTVISRSRRLCAQMYDRNDFCA